MNNKTTFAILLAFVCTLLIGFSLSSKPTYAEQDGLSLSSFPRLAMDHHDEDDHDHHGRHEEDDDEDEWWGEAAEEYEMMFMEIELYSDLFELINDFTAVASDPDKAAISAVLSVDEYLEHEEAVALLEEMLPQVKSPTVRRAIHIHMLDLVEGEDAKTHLRALITGK